MTWLAQFEANLKQEFDGTQFEPQIPSMIDFEAKGIASAEFVGEGWCQCGSTAADSETYFVKPGKGTHGWFHDPRKGGCGGITQTG